VTLHGDRARAETTINVVRSGNVLAQIPAAGSAFAVEALPLADGPNRIHVVGVDALGNRSIPSDDVIVIANRPPPATTLTAAVDGPVVRPDWPAVSGPGRSGSRVVRDGERLTGSSLQHDATAVEASSSLLGFVAAAAFDGDDDTVWIPVAIDPDPTWTVTFPAPVLLESVGLRVMGSDRADVGYRLEALWEDVFVPVARRRAHADQPLTVPLP